MCVQVRAVEEVQPGLMQQAQRFFLLTQIDNLWKEHLQQMQFLRQAVSLRGCGPCPTPASHTPPALCRDHNIITHTVSCTVLYIPTCMFLLGR